MITIKNRQRTIPINIDSLKHDIQLLLNALEYPHFDVGILLTTNATIKKYNKQYRNKDKVTDILSFPFYPDLKPGQKIKANDEDERNLGDLIISLEYVQKDAQKLGVSFQDRMKRLLVHGICHLLGYDHENENDYTKMLKKERQLAPLLGLSINSVF
jgi:rRNA maturation RNase YbeY